jgi:protein mago nashi
MSCPSHVLILVIVCVSDALVAEIKRIVKESEILKYVLGYLYSEEPTADLLSREDDTKWPQKNKDGRQELEIRLGSEHISFEVGSLRPG